MPDLLVRLYDLPDTPATTPAGDVVVRRALPPERRIVVRFVAGIFHDAWAAECETAFSTLPVSVWIAVRGEALLGFACHDATAKGLFGPTGVVESERGKGIGDALLMATLRGMREAGYAYAVIGGAGPVAFYRKRLDALEIPGSVPGLYRGMLPEPTGER